MMVTFGHKSTRVDRRKQKVKVANLKVIARINLFFI
jgi:hypothetical protein